MLFDYEYDDEKEKDIDVDKLLLALLPVQDKKDELINTALPSVTDDAKKEKTHRSISIAEDSNMYLFEDAIEASEDINIDNLERLADSNTQEATVEPTSDVVTDEHDMTIAAEEYDFTKPEGTNIEKNESQLIEKIRLLQDSFDKPYVSKHDIRHEQITELRKVYDKKFSNFEDFVDFLNENKDIVDRQLFHFCYDIFTLPEPEQYSDLFRTGMFSTSPYSDGRGYMINQLKMRMQSL